MKIENNSHRNETPGPGLMEALSEADILADSMRLSEKSAIGILVEDGRQRFFSLAEAGDEPVWWNRLDGRVDELRDMKLFTAGYCPDLIPVIHEIAPNLRPRPLGLDSSFGFGDRTGLATPGHVAAMAEAGNRILPIFAQQSIREMTRTRRSPENVMADATWGAFSAGWAGPCGADADHLKTREDVDATAQAGFCFFTIDPSDHVDQQADNYSSSQIKDAFQALLDDQIAGAADFLPLYSNKTYRIDTGSDKMDITLNEERIQRTAVKYGRGLAFIYDMTEHISSVMGERPFEIEVSVDETDQATSIAEHLLIVLELKRHRVPFVSLAPRFIGDFEKGIDYRGDLQLFEESIQFHAAVAREFGPYKLSLHSGSDKFSVYPLITRACRGCIHVKTAGTSYLEALRVVARTDLDFFRRIIEYSRNRFETDRATYHLSTTLEGSPKQADLADADLEPVYLDEDNGRQILHVTFGSVLADLDENGKPRFGRDLLNLLEKYPDLHVEVLRKHLGRHLKLLRLQ